MRRNIALIAAILVVAVAGFASVASGHGEKQSFKATLGGFQEVPAVSTTGSGEFRMRLGEDGDTLEYELTYSGLTGTASAAHIHVGQKGVDGGVAAFLCGGGDKPACPATEGTVSGVIAAADVIGPAEQGIAAGEFEEFFHAVRHRLTYVNVHTSTFPEGEIRGQVK
jgi:hypothetical protein